MDSPGLVPLLVPGVTPWRLSAGNPGTGTDANASFTNGLLNWLLVVTGVTACLQDAADTFSFIAQVVPSVGNAFALLVGLDQVPSVPTSAINSSWQGAVPVSAGDTVELGVHTGSVLSGGMSIVAWGYWLPVTVAPEG